MGYVPCERRDPAVLPLIEATARAIEEYNASRRFHVYPSILFECGKRRLRYFFNQTAAGGPLGQRQIAYVIDDHENSLPSDPQRQILVRTSLNTALQAPNEFVLPYLFEPLPRAFGPLPRGQLPIVGFCGSAKSSKERMDLLSALEVAARRGVLRTAFLKRESYWGGKPHDPVLRSEFRRNLMDSHFNVASRGKGNFAMRLYQILSAGRIPVLASSSMPLPLSWVVNWSDCVVLEPTALDVVRAIVRLWRAGDEVVARQRRCAMLHQRYFAYPPGASFAKHLVEHLVHVDPGRAFRRHRSR